MKETAVKAIGAHARHSMSGQVLVAFHAIGQHHGTHHGLHPYVEMRIYKGMCFLDVGKPYTPGTLSITFGGDGLPRYSELEQLVKDINKMFDEGTWSGKYNYVFRPGSLIQSV